jgi:hypothetical protein
VRRVCPSGCCGFGFGAELAQVTPTEPDQHLINWRRPIMTLQIALGAFAFYVATAAFMVYLAGF